MPFEPHDIPPGFRAEIERAWEILARLNALTPGDFGAMREILGELTGRELDSTVRVLPPFHTTLNGLTVGAIGEQPDMDWAPVWNTYVRVDDADASAAKVTEAGGEVTMGPFEVGPAGRMVAFDDPEGASLCLWEPGTTRGAQLVNDPGAWVFSSLCTADFGAAESFYASVFGWKLGLADADDSAMFMMPGYQEFLTEKDPELPARLEQVHAPEGFGDVVAIAMPLAEGTAPRWDVTFSVEDTDASAARASELGAEILMEPFDAPWVRVAVVRDPDGVNFTISQFMPPS